jgi:phosphate transport system substrate-binding protein
MHASMKIVESKLAEDGVAIIVHQQNPIPYITAEFVQRIVTRLATNWAQIPESRGSGPIDLVLTGRNSGMYELLQSKIFPGSKLLEPSAIMNNQHDVIQYVSTHPHSVGYIAASLVAGGASSIIKVLPLRVKSSEGEEKDYFPGPQEIHGALYPFHYSLYLYNAEAKVAVGLGFNAFILSNVGQKIIQKAGLVPVSIPYRTIQLTAE